MLQLICIYIYTCIYPLQIMNTLKSVHRHTLYLMPGGFGVIEYTVHVK